MTTQVQTEVICRDQFTRLQLWRMLLVVVMIWTKKISWNDILVQASVNSAVISAHLILIVKVKVYADCYCCRGKQSAVSLVWMLKLKRWKAKPPFHYFFLETILNLTLVVFNTLFKVSYKFNNVEKNTEPSFRLSIELNQ